ncbi:MAG: NADH-quinone oxidoreductase subunit M [Euzebyales bacterium]|nr:NADH-quinone oxidoreductase subunit M [Euzebyales bacterium]MBA3621868.1 NADH-quinone oxidoreductase subunit M [Euzebyales bacterium]
MNAITAAEQVGFPILSTLVFLPVVTLVALGFVRNDRALRHVALAGAVAVLGLSLFLTAGFQRGATDFQFAEQLPWVEAIGLSYHLAVDGVSVLFVPLTALLVVVVMLSTWTAVRHQPKAYLMAVLAFETAAIGVFTAVDLILFFVFWELMLIPTYVLVKVWGTGPQRGRAAQRYVLSMLLGSAALLVGFILLGVSHRSAPGSGGALSFDLLLLMDSTVPLGTQTAVFFLLAFAFALKAPMFPFHAWLPATLLEGPIGMAVFLAGLKMGVFGFLRFVLPLLPDAFAAWSWLIAVLGVVAVLYGALIALVQSDLRRLLAFASVSHVGLAMLGLSSLNAQGLQGALYLIVSLGLVSTGMLLTAGFVQQRVGSTDLAALGGLAQRTPGLATFALLTSLGAVALPGTSGFPGEFLILLGAFRSRGWLATIAVTTVITAAAYVLVFFERAFHGRIGSTIVAAVADLHPREIVAAGMLGVAIVALGVFPTAVLAYSSASVDDLVARLDSSTAVATED